ncbi:MAG TPA: aldehyde dehydrogenase family protein [Stellaceae bacterium]
MNADEQLVRLRLRHRHFLDVHHLGSAKPMDAHCFHHGHGPSPLLPESTQAPNAPPAGPQMFSPHRRRRGRSERCSSGWRRSSARGEADALRLANDTEYGLSSAVFTRASGRTLRHAGGMAHVNNDLPNNPFGGEKNSVPDGCGRIASNARCRAAKARRTARVAARIASPCLVSRQIAGSLCRAAGAGRERLRSSPGRAMLLCSKTACDAPSKPHNSLTVQPYR